MVVFNLIISILMLFATSAWSKSLLIDAPPGSGSFYLTPNTTSPPIFHHQLYGPLGNQTNATAGWHITQWNTWADLPTSAVYNARGPCQARPGTTPSWYASSKSSHVCSWPASPDQAGLVELHQDGSQLPCGAEFDTFLGPNTAVYSHYPSGMVVSQPLGALKALEVAFNVTMAGVPVVTDRCGTSPQCQGGGHVDYGYAVLGVVMDNREQGQTLFYQVNLGDTRDNTGCSHHGNACDVVPLRWYANSNPYGATDSPANYNATCLKMSSASPGTVNTPTAYRLNVLPKLLDALVHGPASLNKDAGEWTVGGCYLGIGMQGSVTQSMYVESLDIVES
eukprot:m.169858 g.169858  ORF g.169858 m.169858 type:complete len:336 (-) comp16673_c0_seq1:2270-3277(-)